MVMLMKIHTVKNVIITVTTNPIVSLKCVIVVEDRAMRNQPVVPKFAVNATEQVMK
jgi:hypothetical protein